MGSHNKRSSMGRFSKECFTTSLQKLYIIAKDSYIEIDIVGSISTSATSTTLVYTW